MKGIYGDAIYDYDDEGVKSNEAWWDWDVRGRWKLNKGKQCKALCSEARLEFHNKVW